MFWKNFAAFAFWIPAGCFVLWVISTLSLIKFIGKDATLLQWDLILGKVYWVSGATYFIAMILGGYMGFMPDPGEDE